MFVQHNSIRCFIIICCTDFFSSVMSTAYRYLFLSLVVAAYSAMIPKQQIDKSPCRDLTGNWRNELNSTMIVKQMEDFLVGFYSTAVESKNGSSGGPNRTLIGTVGKIYSTSGVLATWTVMWNNGTSATTWNGQCYNDCLTNIDILSTTWILRDLQKSCNSDWAASRVGQDIFYRVKN